MERVNLSICYWNSTNICFEAELKKEEMRTLEEELQVEMKRVVELRAERH